MKVRVLMMALLVALLVGGAGGAAGQGVTTAGVAGAAAEGRVHVPMLTGWRFLREDAAGAQEVGFNDGAWQTVDVPHTWNNLDGEDGGNNYYRGVGWYRRHVTVGEELKGKSLYLRFEGINRKAEIYVNGALLGSHAGGQAAICLDATRALKAGDNVVAVKVSNRVDQDMAPLQADFTFYGGMYRPAELIAVNDVHFSLTDFASSGVYVTTPAVSADAATIHARAFIDWSGKSPVGGWSILASLKDADGKIVASGMASLSGKAQTEASLDLKLANPHLWNGRADPYLYTLELRTACLVMDEMETLRGETVSVPVGIRTCAVDPAKGFLLNGKPYDLHGVNRHQEVQDKGWALSEADHVRDMALIKEMGCTAIRLAHYQHASFFYDLCDKEGIIVWAEIPVVDKLGNTNSTFTENAKQQYTELIRQNFNHPSIAFWSAGNEVDPSGGNFNRNGPAVYPWFAEMSALGHKEDPSRLTTAAWREKFFPPAGTTDVFGLNEYLGWYTGGGPGNNSGWQGLETYIADHSDPAKGGSKGMWAITEYGAGASIYFHSEKPVRMDHTEEYQALLHENTWKVLQGHPEIWGKFVWSMFDFAVDNRAEGDHAGINDKGLVTHDRQTRKDAFYFYKAVWSSAPTLWIAGKRFAVRGVDHIPVKVYTNAREANLVVNGVSLGRKSPVNGTIVWDDVPLQAGANAIRVSSITGGMGTGRAAPGTAPAPNTVDDTATWTYTPGAPTEVYEGQDARMKQALQSGPPRAR